MEAAFLNLALISIEAAETWLVISLVGLSAELNPLSRAVMEAAGLPGLFLWSLVRASCILGIARLSSKYPRFRPILPACAAWLSLIVLNDSLALWYAF